METKSIHTTGTTNGSHVSLSELAAILCRIEKRLDRLEQALATEHIQPAIATLTDIVDETMAHAASEGMELEHLIESSQKAMLRLAQLVSAREVQPLFDSGRLDLRALAPLGVTLRAVAEASEVSAPRVGLFGLLRAGRNPSVQKALGFLLSVAEKLGRNLETTKPKHLLNGKNHLKSESQS